MPARLGGCFSRETVHIMCARDVRERRRRSPALSVVPVWSHLPRWCLECRAMLRARQWQWQWQPEFERGGGHCRLSATRRARRAATYMA